MTNRSAARRASNSTPIKKDKTYRKSPAMLAKQQAREQEVVLAATTVLLTHGWLEFTMDKVLSAAPLSRGTLYKHFCNREDLGMAMAVELLRRHMEFVSHQSGFQGNSRERFVAQLGAFRLFAQVRPELNAALINLYNPEIRNKASSHWRGRFYSAFNDLIKLPLGLIREAYDAGDIKGSPDSTAERICYSIWSALFGFSQLIRVGIPLHPSIESDVMGFQNELVDCVLDGHGWKPLSADFDYAKTLDRLWSGYYPLDEVPHPR